MSAQQPTYELGEIMAIVVKVRDGTVRRERALPLPEKQGSREKRYYLFGDSQIRIAGYESYGEQIFVTKEDAIAYLERWAVVRRKELSDVYRWLESEVGR